MIEQGLSRRGFLGVLMAAAPAVVLAKQGALWLPPAGVVDLPPLEAGAPIGLRFITYKIAEGLRARGLYGMPVFDLHKMGEGAMRHQWNVTATFPEQVGPEGLTDRLIEPVAESLFERIRYDKARTFGELLLPAAGDPGCGVVQAHTVRSKRGGFSIRGLELAAYDISEARWRHEFRWDILGG